MKEQLEAIKVSALEELSKVNEKAELENIRVKYLGKKGELTAILRGMGKLSAEERPLVGKVANEVREALENEITAKMEDMKNKEKEERLKSEIIDISMPGKKQIIGKRHPIDLTLERINDIFLSMGFSIEEGPEVEYDYSPIFYQIEGLVIDKGITFADLKGTLEMFTQKMFGDEMKTKFRPHHFPFTEPSAELDATCFVCMGEGCKVCKGSGWIELLGCGMVHPNVLRNCGIDPEVYSGFAFGFGLDRITMLKYGIDDIRLLYESDMRFLDQF